MANIFDLIESNDMQGLSDYLAANKGILASGVRQLINRGYDEASPLHYAVSQLNYAAVVLLLDTLSDDQKKQLIKRKDDSGKTVLHHLVENAERHRENAILIYTKLLTSLPKDYRSKFLAKQDKLGRSALYTLVSNANKEDKVTDELIEKLVAERVDLKLDQMTLFSYSVMKLLPSSQLSDISQQRLIYAHERMKSSSYAATTALTLQQTKDTETKEIANKPQLFENETSSWFDEILVAKNPNNRYASRPDVAAGGARSYQGVNSRNSKQDHENKNLPKRLNSQACFLSGGGKHRNGSQISSPTTTTRTPQSRSNNSTSTDAVTRGLTTPVKTMA